MASPNEQLFGPRISQPADSPFAYGAWTPQSLYQGLPTPSGPPAMGGQPDVQLPAPTLSSGSISPMLDSGSWWGDWANTLSGGSHVANGAKPTLMQSAAGYLDDKTSASVKGWGSGAFDLGKNLMGGYLQYQNMKTAQDTLDFQKNSWLKNYAAQKHMFNQNVRDTNAVRDSRKGGARHIDELA